MSESPTSSKKLDRRTFLWGTVAVGSVANLGRIAYEHLNEPDSGYNPAAPEALVAPPGWKMKYRVLGRTGLTVSEVSFGGYPTNNPNLVKYAFDRGITYFDTSHCYRGGKSEEVIGEGLQGIRDKVVVTTKWCPHHSKKAATKAVFLEQLETSLRRLRTDYVDIVLNHACSKSDDGQGLSRLQNPEMLEAFETAKRDGKVRFLGASGHGPDLMEIMGYAVESNQFDVLLCRYSFLDYPAQLKLIQKAQDKGVGFVAMKTLAGAKGQDLDNFRGRFSSFKQAALRWVLSNEQVSTLIISITDQRQIDEYVLASNTQMTSNDYQHLQDYQAMFSTEVCRFCGACQTACPSGTRIADILRFKMYHSEYKQENRAIEAYAGLVAAERAAHCGHCAGFCEQACSYDLPVQSLALQAHNLLHEKPFLSEDGAAAGKG